MSLRESRESQDYKIQDQDFSLQEGGLDFNVQGSLKTKAVRLEGKGLSFKYTLGIYVISSIGQWLKAEHWKDFRSVTGNIIG